MLTPTILNFNQINTNYRNNVRNNNYLRFNGLHFKGKELNKDTFELSSTYNKDDYNTIINSVKDENFIGSGSEGHVFFTEDKNYVVKIPNDFFNGKKIDNSSLKNDLKEEEITEQDEVNHIVKKYKNGITIMKKIPGKPISSLEDMNEVADLPIKSYQKLLNQILDAEYQGMEFDYAMNNVLYDKDTKSLTAIDFRPLDEDNLRFNPLEKMYFAFDCFKKPYEKKIAGKILCATLNNFKSGTEDRKAKLNYDFNEIIRILQYNNPKDRINTETIKSYMQTTALSRLKAETDFDFSRVDDYVHYTKSLIASTLINESEQA